MKYIGIAAVIVVIIGGAYLLFKTEADAPVIEEERTADIDTADADARTATVRTSLYGDWESVDDAQFVRRFSEHAYEDRYDDELVSGGSWSIFTRANAPDSFPYPVDDSTQYLVLDDDDGALYFSIAEHTDEQLVLIYLNRGGVLEFRRVVE